MIFCVSDWIWGKVMCWIFLCCCVRQSESISSTLLQNQANLTFCFETIAAHCKGAYALCCFKWWRREYLTCVQCVFSDMCLWGESFDVSVDLCESFLEILGRSPSFNFTCMIDLYESLDKFSLSGRLEAMGLRQNGEMQCMMKCGWTDLLAFTSIIHVQVGSSGGACQIFSWWAM